MTFSYELVSTGGYPTGKQDAIYTFHVPVSVGDKIRLRNGDITRVETIEHREQGSVIYCFMNSDMTNW